MTYGILSHGRMAGFSWKTIRSLLLLGEGLPRSGRDEVLNPGVRKPHPLRLHHAERDFVGRPLLKGEGYQRRVRNDNIVKFYETNSIHIK